MRAMVSSSIIFPFKPPAKQGVFITNKKNRQALNLFIVNEIIFNTIKNLQKK